jgi:uncharacterized protein YndB with AHSA1/START domain
MTSEPTGDETAVEMRRHLSAPPRRVFAAFSDPELVQRWLSPSPEIALSILQLDFRVGGTYRFAYRVPGREPMIVNGVYRTIEPPSKIVFSWNIEPPDEHAGLQSEVTVSIAPDGDGSLLLIRHVNLSLARAAARHAEGWRGALDRLPAVLASMEAEDGR